MLLSRLLANFTRGQSDTLRKAMGKKLIDKMQELKTLFLEGGQANGHDPKILEKVWADWEKFASYAFNKSHATCYSWVAFQTAYLKANYPAEYMAAVMSRNRSDTEKLSGFIDECKKMHIRVKGPDVNESFSDFGVNSQGDIRFGLAALKGIGEGVAAEILRARNSGDGPFRDIYDFVERVSPSVLNRRTIETLAYAGAFDCFVDQIAREDFFEKNAKGETFAEALLRYGQLVQADKMNQSLSLFDDDESAMAISGRPPVIHAIPWIDAVRLEKEREIVGTYHSANPLDPFYMELHFGCVPVKTFSELVPEEGRSITVGGMVVDWQQRMDKKGQPFGIMKIQDYTGSSEFRFFSNDFYEFGKYGVAGTCVCITGTYSRRFATSDLSFRVNSVDLLVNRKGHMIDALTVHISPDAIGPDFAQVIRDHFAKPVGESSGMLNFHILDPSTSRSVTLSPSRQCALDKELVEILESFDLQFTPHLTSRRD